MQSELTLLCVHRDPEPGLKTAYGLCQQMTHFFHQLRLYITFEVIEPAWLRMVARMKAAKTLDEVPFCAPVMDTPLHVSEERLRRLASTLPSISNATRARSYLCPAAMHCAMNTAQALQALVSSPELSFIVPQTQPSCVHMCR